MAARIIEGERGRFRMLTSPMPDDTPFPHRIAMPVSTFFSSNFYSGYPNPVKAFNLFIPALRAIHNTGAFHVRESTCSLLLHPFSNVENRTSVTTAVEYHMPFDIRRLPHGRMRRVMSSLSKRADVDLVMQDVSPQEFVGKSSGDLKRQLIDAYFPFAKARRVYESPVLRNVLSFLGLAQMSPGRERYATKFTVEALTRADTSVKFGDIRRPMLLVIEEGSWDPGGNKPYMDAQFGVLEGRFGRGSFNKLFSIGIKPVFTHGKDDDTRDAPWVVSWDRLVHGKLRGIEDLSLADRELLKLANAQAQIYINEGRPYPERRIQEGGIFAQNLAVDDALYPIPTRRLSRDMLIELAHEQLIQHTRPIHIDASIRERSIEEQMEQYRRAARKHILYGVALNNSEEGKAHLRETGLAIDDETVRCIQTSVSPDAFRRRLKDMDQASRDGFLDAALADDLVSMHAVFEFISTYRKLGLFKYYPTLSQITEAEWDRVVDAMIREKKVGDPTMFQRKQYATIHAHEYEEIDDDDNTSMTNELAQWDLFKKYVNPYALFVRGIRKARVASKNVRAIVSGCNYLENVDRLLSMDPSSDSRAN